MYLRENMYYFYTFYCLKAGLKAFNTITILTLKKNKFVPVMKHLLFLYV